MRVKKQRVTAVKQEPEVLISDENESDWCHEKLAVVQHEPIAQLENRNAVPMKIRPGHICARLPTELWLNIISYVRDYIALTSLTTVCVVTRQILSDHSDKVWKIALNSFFATRWKPYTYEGSLRERAIKIGCRTVLRILFDLKCTDCRAEKSQIYWRRKKRLCPECAGKNGLKAVNVGARAEFFRSRWRNRY